MLIKAISIIFKIFSPKIRVRGLFNGAEYSLIYMVSIDSAHVEDNVSMVCRCFRQ